MSYDARTRDRYRLAVLATTATLGAAAITATGWLTGAAAHAQDEKEAQEQANQDADARAAYDSWVRSYGSPEAQEPRTIVRERPSRTRVTTRYVTAAAPPSSVGGGGTVSQAAQPQPAAAPAAQPAAQPAQPAAQPAPPPPPPPPPAPSSGS